MSDEKNGLVRIVVSLKDKDGFWTKNIVTYFSFDELSTMHAGILRTIGKLARTILKGYV